MASYGADEHGPYPCRMRSTIAVIALALVATSCSSTSDPTVEYLAELRPIAVEANVVLGDAIGTISTRFDTRGQLFLALASLQLPSGVAIALDKARRVEPPSESATSHERYLDYLAELLRITEDFDGAVANSELDDVVAAMVRFRSAESALALALPPDMCRQIAPSGSRDLCAPGSPFTGYEATLDRVLRQFVAGYRPAADLPTSLGNAARSHSAVLFAPQVLDVIRRARLDLRDVTPDADVADVHDTVTAYFDEIEEAWNPLFGASTFSDPLIIGSLEARLTVAMCRAVDALAVPLSGVEADGRLATIVGVAFTQPDGVCPA